MISTSWFPDLRVIEIFEILPTFFVLHELFFRADGHDLISPSFRFKVVEFSLNVAHSSITKKGAPLDGVPIIELRLLLRVQSPVGLGIRRFGWCAGGLFIAGIFTLFDPENMMGNSNMMAPSGASGASSSNPHQENPPHQEQPLAADAPLGLAQQPPA